jgi:AcrR family transcriptional regulator
MPRGRRPGTSTTREAVLEAARRRFAEVGFDVASIRTIAAAAGVDPALVLHHFGSKEHLFREAVAWPFDPSALERVILDGGSAGLGERLARVFFQQWDDAATWGSLLAVLRSALTHAESATLLRQFLRDQLLRRLANVLEGADRDLRVELAAAHLLGVAIVRHLLQLEPLASASVDDLAARLGPALDRDLGTG